MKPILKCIHPLLPVSIGTFLLLLIFFYGRLEPMDLFPIGQAGGPCLGVPVFVFFLPSYLMFVLGLGFSGIRLFEFRCKQRKAREDAE
jgi:hypothetical protein